MLQEMSKDNTDKVAAPTVANSIHNQTKWIMKFFSGKNFIMTKCPL